MGGSFSKSGVLAEKVVDHEFTYRYDNTKKLRASLQALMKSLNDSNTAVMNTPARFIDVGESYMALDACMNHGGAGGASQSTTKRKSDANVAYTDEGPDLSGGAGSRRGTISRKLAKESYDSAQAFAESMRKLREHDYQSYRHQIETDIIQRATTLSVSADNTIAFGKIAEAESSKYAAAAQKVDDIEKKCAKKGKDPSANKKHESAVADRNKAEATAREKKDQFHESYEELMVRTQAFSVESMDRFMDLNVTYYKEFVRVVDVAETPTKGFSVARTECHEPGEFKEI